MPVINKLLSLFAPDDCMVCGREGWLLCEACRNSELVQPPSNCYRCGRLSRNYETCKSCRRKSPLQSVWCAAAYDGVAKQVVSSLKYDIRRGAVDAMAVAMNEVLPDLSTRIVIVPLPTSPDRVRLRGFDQSVLLAKELAHYTGQPYVRALRRNTKAHQVGATRAERLRQISGAFRVVHSHAVVGAVVLIVDDVMTTGASLEEAARALRKCGASRIYGITFAR